MSIRPDDRKLRELILYIATRCKGDPGFGKTKLNKILFYSDFGAYAELGEPITGQPYMRIDHGPGPRRLKPVLDALLAAGEVEIRRETVFRHRQERVVALRPADPAAFTQAQLAIVDRVVAELWGRTNKDVSALSHAHLGWKAARDRETIPYETAFLTDRPLTEAEIEHGRRLAIALGLRTS